MVTDRRGQVLTHVRYAPYGGVLGYFAADGSRLPSSCGAGQSCREYTGYESEPISGLQYAGARFYDPDHGVLEGWLRDGQVLREIPTMNGWTSPRLKVRFELVDGRLYLYGRDGRRFLTYVELMEQWEREQRERQHAHPFLAGHASGLVAPSPDQQS